MSDVKLRLSHTMTNTDGGKKVTAAMASTGRAVGGAVSQAKGVFSSWWGGIKPGKEVSPGEEVKEVESNGGRTGDAVVAKEAEVVETKQGATEDVQHEEISKTIDLQQGRGEKERKEET